MNIYKTGKFSLKEKDFHSGKLISPPRKYWKTCACCGKQIVQGSILSNGDTIGDDCMELINRCPYEMRSSGSLERLFVMWGAIQKARNYCLTIIMQPYSEISQ
jgi:hypothetical protein